MTAPKRCGSIAGVLGEQAPPKRREFTSSSNATQSRKAKNDKIRGFLPLWVAPFSPRDSNDTGAISSNQVRLDTKTKKILHLEQA